MDYTDLLIRPEESLVSALQKLDETSKRTLIVVDGDERLRGVLTDGDVRRCLLRTGSLDAQVMDACNVHPYSLKAGEEDAAAALYKEYDISVIPVVDEDGRVCSCLLKHPDLVVEKNIERLDVPVVIMAGGLGTRLYPYTKILPKPLIPVNDVPIVERIIDSFHRQGAEKFVMIVNHKKEMIKAYFEDVVRDYEIQFVDETEFLGTGGGLRLAKDELPETFFLTNCDILIDDSFAKALELHRINENAVTMIASLKNYVIPYGTVEFDTGGKIAKMVEKPEIPFMVNTGCYIVEKNVLDYISEGESIGFPELISRCQEDGLNVGIYPISENSWFDMGQLDEMERMAEHFNGAER